MTLPYAITAGDDADAAPVQANFTNLDGRVASLESQVANLNRNVDLYSNGVFTGGLTASAVSTSLTYTAGGFICSHVYYYKTTLSVDFTGLSADTYYVEADSSGEVDVYTSSSTDRTNLNTVDWSGSGFNSIATTDRTILYADANYAVLTGRAGGQTIQGGTAASETLTLESTSHATKGVVLIKTATIQHKLTTQTGTALTISSSHNVVVCDTTSNAITVTLPDANTILGQEILIVAAVRPGSYDVTINAASGDTFNATGNNRCVLDAVDDFFCIVAISANRWLIKASAGTTLSTA